MIQQYTVLAALLSATSVSSSILPTLIPPIPWPTVFPGFPFPPPSPSSSPPPPSFPSTFRILENVVGNDFYSAFTWFTNNDPTHGRVNYVDQETAQNKNLTSATSNSFIMRADDTNVVPTSARGRDSNRIVSVRSYVDSVLILDAQHMPTGCGTWPAWWTVTDSGNWPNGGEIDIIEGVNTNPANLVSLHTSANCTMPESRAQTGQTQSTDCDANKNQNQGCGTSISKSASYGALFNSMGGGWYAMQRTQRDGVKVWFWGRNDDSVPSQVKYGGETINPEASWGVPDATFPSTSSCDFANHFGAHEIVFDLTFCGDWAGNVYAASGCGSSYNDCVAHVNNDPSSFSEAYWEINSLRIYIP